MAKMWTGRFKKEIDMSVNDFNSSISFDCVMYRQDIMGSIAHATMLGACNIIEQREADTIIEGLKGILSDLENGTIRFNMTSEDIHMFIEEELTKRLGETGKRLHTARSRNDQVALDIRMYLKDEIKELKSMLIDMINVLCQLSEENLATVMPGYTHLQRAQPITFAHHLMAYTEMFLRDMGRLDDTYKRTDVMPLGSGALASTTYPIDRMYTTDLLGFEKPTANSLDGVSDRDFCIELLNGLAIIMMHLSRLSEEIILWCSWEFKFIELDDSYATGSSIMPQKKNPDVAELVRGKAGRTIGNLTTLLTVLKGLPLAYNKDMQEDKEAVFDSVNTVKLCLPVFTEMMKTMTVNKKNMANAAARGFINATDCADYLVKKGMAFRDAYKITGELVAMCIEQDTVLEDLPLALFQKHTELFDEDIFSAIELETCVSMRNVLGGPSPEAVSHHIHCVKKQLEAMQKDV